MIKKELYITREDGMQLFRTFSDSGVMIKKNGTDQVYAKAIDVENSGFTYTETDISIETMDKELTLEDTLEMLEELGVDISEEE